VVANLPYNAATEIFFRLDSLPQITDMTLMFQREVAQRFVAPPGGGSYGPLALLSAIRWVPEIVLQLPPGAFWPRPKVFSAAVRFRRRPQPGVPPELEPSFRDLVRAAFQQRRKMIKNPLARWASPEEIAAAGVDPQARPETLSLADFLRLASRLAACDRMAP
jgi:16S rRNA (adenine1518-N6/adenine1519-N6)-dimethyltransferase